MFEVDTEQVKGSDVVATLMTRVSRMPPFAPKSSLGQKTDDNCADGRQVKRKVVYLNERTGIATLITITDLSFWGGA